MTFTYKVVDRLGVGHTNADCPEIEAHRGKAKDALEARDPWPCGKCIPTKDLPPLPKPQPVREVLDRMKDVFG